MISLKKFKRAISNISDFTWSHDVSNSKLEKTILPFQGIPDKTHKLTKFWIPPVSPWKVQKSRNSNVRFAAITEERLYHGLRFEGQLILLTPDNWKQVLKYGKPDFLIIESIWNTATGHWHMGQFTGSPTRTETEEIVLLARRLSIPTVFWMTKGHEYHKHYAEFAHFFDFVFCADYKDVEMFKKEGLRAEFLPPCVQPALFNPFRYYKDKDAFNICTLYDGWADLDRFENELSFMKEVRTFGLKIIESRYHLFRQRLDALPDYKDFILGCVSLNGRIQALKYATSYLTLNKTLSSRTTQQWMTLEATASRLPAIYNGTLMEYDTLNDIVIECKDETECLMELIRFQEDNIYRDRLAHIGWRRTYLEHTFSHRIKRICESIGIEHGWSEYPKVSLIIPTHRQELLQKSIRTFTTQNYPNKQLIIVFNGNSAPKIDDLGIAANKIDVKITNVPSELFAGACLNQGIILSEGEYCFRIDDDDHYAPNYVMDMILQARSIDAEFFGKPPAPVCFEDDKTAYSRDDTYHLCIVDAKRLSKGQVRFGGNSFAGLKTTFHKFPYDDASYGAADTSLLYSLKPETIGVCAIMDRMNLVAIRSNDNSNHTWKIEASSLKNADKIVSFDDCIV